MSPAAGRGNPGADFDVFDPRPALLPRCGLAVAEVAKKLEALSTPRAARAQRCLLYDVGVS